MAVRAPLRSTCVALVVVVAANVAVGCDSGEVLLRYVSLGDSFPAGEGLRGATGPCRRSPLAYPNLLAQRTNLLPSLHACSGATTEDVLERAQHPDEGRAQIEWVAPDTDVVTLTVGGNDVGFGRVVGACLSGADPCSRLDGEVDARIIALKERLAVLNREIRRRVPEARLLVVGYPHLIADPTLVELDRCRELGGTSPEQRISQEEVEWLREKGDALNVAMRESARAAGARYVDSARSFAGHEACTAVPWVAGFAEADVGASFHPNAAGHQALARLLAAEVTSG